MNIFQLIAGVAKGVWSLFSLGQIQPIERKEPTMGDAIKDAEKVMTDVKSDEAAADAAYERTKQSHVDR